MSATQKTRIFLNPVCRCKIFCTGCGMCEQVCVTPKASIFVLPLDYGLGSSNEQYVEGWIEGKDKKLQNSTPQEYRQDSKKLNDY